MVLIRPATRPTRASNITYHREGESNGKIERTCDIPRRVQWFISTFVFRAFFISSFAGLGRQPSLPLAILSRISSGSFPRGIRDKSKRHHHMFPRRHLSTGPPLPGFRRCGGFRNYSVATLQSSRDAHSDASPTKGTRSAVMYKADQAELSWRHGYLSSHSYF